VRQLLFALLLFCGLMTNTYAADPTKIKSVAEWLITNGEVMPKQDVPNLQGWGHDFNNCPGYPQGISVVFLTNGQVGMFMVMINDGRNIIATDLGLDGRIDHYNVAQSSQLIPRETVQSIFDELVEFSFINTR